MRSSDVNNTLKIDSKMQVSAIVYKYWMAFIDRKIIASDDRTMISNRRV